MNKEFYDYSDVRLVPKLGIVSSRSQCDTTIELGGHYFNVPVYPANMKSVVDEETCIFMARNAYFYTMHRFFDVETKEEYVSEQMSFCAKMRRYFISISLGVKPKDIMVIDAIAQKFKSGEWEKDTILYITIDVAHGHSLLVKNVCEYIKEKLNDKAFLIVGNVCTEEAVIDLEKWGANAAKIGIAPGSVCTSYLKTGVGSSGWQLSCVNKCASVAKIPIIADGGIKNHGDIAIAIAAGAQMVMAGSLFAAYDQSAGNIIEIENRMYKEYYGSASKYNKREQKNIEGKKILIEYKGDMTRLLAELKEDLQSAISYVGAKNIEGLQKAEYIIIR